jgi:hypothetical protein
VAADLASEDVVDGVANPVSDEVVNCTEGLEWGMVESGREGTVDLTSDKVE